MTAPIRRKLIEVALPLEAINTAAEHEKSVPRRGHPATLHLWWARRPLAACRAVLFASLVDDPSSDPERFPTLKAQEDERRRLFGIIEELVQWENSTNERVLEAARAEILRSTGGTPPPLLDPFCGGGSIPLEAQRLGLIAHASDLNPVAVLITKALIEIPPKFAGLPPVHPAARRGVGATGTWTGASGLAEDVRRYGAWMRDEAQRRIGHLYPRVRLSREQGGGEATVIAWLWARTVTCPNPACGARMPLVRSFVLSTKKGKEARVEPIVDRAARTVQFEIRSGPGKPAEAPKVGRGATFRCLVCEQVAPDEHIKAEGRAGRMDAQLMAIVAEGARNRTYVAPTPGQDAIARSAVPTWGPEEELADDPRALWTVNYGLTRFRDLFTARQLVALATFSDLVGEARERVRRDASATGDRDPAAYADAVATYLAFSISKLADWSSALCSWIPQLQGVGHVFKRQALPMMWDFVEINPLGDSVGNFLNHVEWVSTSLDTAATRISGSAHQADVSSLSTEQRAVVSTDPPYYDNIGYADLSDFFYVWLRRSLASVYPELFGTVLTPKADELVATPYRFGGDKKKAEQHFESGLGDAFNRIRAIADPTVPVTIYYAFKQAESDDEGDGAAVASTGWETMLEALLAAGFAIDGTWPMRTERGARSISVGKNALASSIVLVCRPRASDAGITDRRGFLASLKADLPEALRTLQHGNIAPVDLAQAAIGPGMAVFSRYARVVEPDGSPMTVRAALGIINGVLAEVLSEQEDEFDNDTRWAVTWFEQNGHRDGKFGDAEVLSKAKDTGVNALRAAGILLDGAGKVRLKRRDELDASWDPMTDKRLTVWEVTQHLIRALDEGGEAAAADLVRRVGGLADTARDLAYRLYAICERRKWADEALGYNKLVTSWPEITRLAASTSDQPRQETLFA